MNSSTETGQSDGPSFDDDVVTSAQQQARILRELGYRTEAAHIERFLDRQIPVAGTPVPETPAA